LRDCRDAALAVSAFASNHGSNALTRLRRAVQPAPSAGVVPENNAMKL
jgi:Flp pilus assembly protein TadD